MMMMAIIFLAAWLMLAVAPGTPIGRFLRRIMVEAPAARLSRIRRGQVLLAILLTATIATLIAVIGLEAVHIMAFGAPDIASAIMTLEVSTWLDIAAAALMAASAIRVKALGQHVRTLVTRRPRATRARRTRHPGATPPANDDEHRPAILRAA